MNSLLLAVTREFSYLWAVIVPGSIVVFSFLVTLWLYRLFAREHHGREDRQDRS